MIRVLLLSLELDREPFSGNGVLATSARSAARPAAARKKPRTIKTAKTATSGRSGCRAAAGGSGWTGRGRGRSSGTSPPRLASRVRGRPRSGAATAISTPRRRGWHAGTPTK
ncbi:hypothetical protein THAOC_29607 [Thalassiosira oceanica]|uniref:Uncharacterized protein n=1 Tax=Thalassiosira oceanica TaxID=159749 RepID=K0RC16_THAOC|nr:hypothetical protein THAOC_29607 [Thalassiosira oceanica]|eukprot:EJK51238.1 hypothetical protein THAOC_29607 [Thalassiosira oceanica]